MDADAALALRLLLAIGTSLLLTFTLGRVLLKLDLRGAGVVGGVCAGIALGPLVFGNLAPSLHEHLNQGGVIQREALESFLLERVEDEQALADVGVSEEAIDEAVLSNDVRQDLLESALADERRRMRVAPLALSASLGLIALMLGAWLGFGLSATGLRVGMLSGLLAMLVWAVVSRRMIDTTLPESILAGAMLAGGTCWARGRWRFSVGLGSLAIVLALLAIAGATRSAWSAGAALTLGAVLSRTTPLSQRARARWASFGHATLVPVVITIVVSSCALTPSSNILAFVILAGVFAGDAHLIGAWIALGSLETGRRRELPVSSWNSVYAQGWAGTTVIITGLVFASGVLEPHTELGGAIGLAVALHALIVELSRPSSMKLLASMRQMRREEVTPL